MEKQTEQMIVNRIRNQYEEHKETKLEALQKLDETVRHPAKVFSYILGILGALVLGVGMCLAMKVIGDSMLLGIVIGCVGIIIVSINYLIYKAITYSRKKKYSSEILNLTNELINN